MSTGVFRDLDLAIPKGQETIGVHNSVTILVENGDAVTIMTTDSAQSARIFPLYRRNAEQTVEW